MPCNETMTRALRRILESPEIRSRLATSAKARADREFTIEAMADRYEAMYYR